MIQSFNYRVVMQHKGELNWPSLPPNSTHRGQLSSPPIQTATNVGDVHHKHGSDPGAWWPAAGRGRVCARRSDSPPALIRTWTSVGLCPCYEPASVGHLRTSDQQVGVCSAKLHLSIARLVREAACAGGFRNAPVCVTLQGPPPRALTARAATRRLPRSSRTKGLQEFQRKTIVLYAEFASGWVQSTQPLLRG